MSLVGPCQGCPRHCLCPPPACVTWAPSQHVQPFPALRKQPEDKNRTGKSQGCLTCYSPKLRSHLAEKYCPSSPGHPNSCRAGSHSTSHPLLTPRYFLLSFWLGVSQLVPNKLLFLHIEGEMITRAWIEKAERK